MNQDQLLTRFFNSEAGQKILEQATDENLQERSLLVAELEQLNDDIRELSVCPKIAKLKANMEASEVAHELEKAKYYLALHDDCQARQAAERKIRKIKEELDKTSPEFINTCVQKIKNLLNSHGAVSEKRHNEVVSAIKIIISWRKMALSFSEMKQRFNEIERNTAA